MAASPHEHRAGAGHRAAARRPGRGDRRDRAGAARRMILADLGADVIRVDRPGGQPLTGGSRDLLNRGRPSVALDLKHPDGVATVLRLVETADVLRRGAAPRRHRTARARPRRLPGPQPAAGLRPDDRLGPDRPAGATTAGHDLNYVAITGALLRAGPGPGPAALPDEPGRRLRRRVDVPRHRGPRRPARGPGLGRGAGRRRRDRRRHRSPQRHDREPPGERDGHRAPRGEPPRRRGAVLRPLRDRRRPAPVRRRPRAAVLRRPARAASASATPRPTATTPPTTPALRDADRRDRSRPDARPSGPRSSTAPTPASPRCCRSARRRTTRTWPRGGRTSTATAPREPAPAPRFSRTASTLARRRPPAPACTPARR